MIFRVLAPFMVIISLISICIIPLYSINKALRKELSIIRIEYDKLEEQYTSYLVLQDKLDVLIVDLQKRDRERDKQTSVYIKELKELRKQNAEINDILNIIIPNELLIGLHPFAEMVSSPNVTSTK